MRLGAKALSKTAKGTVAREVGGFARVPGATSRILRDEVDEAEIELFRRSEKFGTEYARYTQGGKQFERAGKATEVKIPSGDDVADTLHTHPTSKYALPSKDDVIDFRGAFQSGTSHSVLGSAFPAADKFLKSEGLEPFNLVMKTIFKQENLESPLVRFFIDHLAPH
jgi:hypothetical protein